MSRLTCSSNKFFLVRDADVIVILISLIMMRTMKQGVGNRDSESILGLEFRAELCTETIHDTACCNWIFLLTQVLLSCCGKLSPKLLE
jgi:hypothetical protein